VTITFLDQKNGTKMDVRTQQKTGDPVLCSVIQAHTLVSRIHQTVPHYTGSTMLNTIHLAGKNVSISSKYLLQQLRFTCRSCGDKLTFGFTSTSIGTHSLQSGGAMALFLNDHPVHKIMIFGRWSSDAFLVYIRPQVLEWTDNMSHDMILHDTFLDATDNHQAHQEDPVPDNRSMALPSLYLACTCSTDNASIGTRNSMVRDPFPEGPEFAFFEPKLKTAKRQSTIVHTNRAGNGANISIQRETDWC